MDTLKDSQNTEEIILAAAEQEFLNKGYSLTRMTDIARLAGVNHALLHYYYRSKDKLFATVFEKKMQQVIFSFMSVIAQDLTLKEKIKAGVEAHFDIIAQNPKLPFFIVNEFLTNEERVKMVRPMLEPIIKELYASFERDLQKAVEEKQIRPVTPANLLYNIVTLNICSFIAKPFACLLLELNEEEYQHFINQRKAENVTTVLCRLGFNE
ncbi:MAG: TetR/AcrR family transcriptional regulator [Bacteroidales bacterium]|jgi:AcrR family transcriptional regulator|nr:TetR/AcrR family transcriptional regulator [Bacteroidales bacterium]